MGSAHTNDSRTLALGIAASIALTSSDEQGGT
jgi:hypothetical protein